MPTRSPRCVQRWATPSGGLAGGVLRGEDAEVQQVPQARRAVSSADIEYFKGNLQVNTVYAWTGEDEKLPERMQQC